MNQDPFKEYFVQAEPDKRDKGYAWQTAIGLQAVDGLKTSKYLQDTAIQNIEGEISFDEASVLLDSYYKQNPKIDEVNRTEEADKVALRIAKLLSEKAFSFTPMEYIAIHKKLFTDIYAFAGEIREYNITKKEWVLDGETVLYASASELQATLEYDFMQEKNFNFKGLSIDEIINHLAKFIAGIWQIHIFPEGNTRTTAVFFIKYLNSLGFQATNDIFADNSWYFRNALVRANYNDLAKGIYQTTEFLELFLKNLLCQQHNELSNRSMHVSGTYKTSQKANIEDEKLSIDALEVYNEKLTNFTSKTTKNVQMMFDEFATNTTFGRSDAQKVLGLGNTSASALLKKLLEAKIIETVLGQGKGKYKFCDKSDFSD